MFSPETGLSPPPCDIRQLLGTQPLSTTYVEYIQWLSACLDLSASVAPEIKSYPDAVYFNYYRLGMSVMFAPRSGYNPKNITNAENLDSARLSLDSIDIYHTPATTAVPSTAARQAKTTSEYSSFAGLPLHLQLSTQPVVNEIRSTEIAFSTTSTGKDIVSILGEPDRKGGGSGPASGSIGIWCEWSKEGLMIEFGGDGARGPQAWEKGKDAPWKIITVFPPKK